MNDTENEVVIPLGSAMPAARIDVSVRFDSDLCQRTSQFAPLFLSPMFMFQHNCLMSQMVRSCYASASAWKSP